MGWRLHAHRAGEEMKGCRSVRKHKRHCQTKRHTKTDWQGLVWYDDPAKSAKP